MEVVEVEGGGDEEPKEKKKGSHPDIIFFFSSHPFFLSNGHLSTEDLFLPRFFGLWDNEYPE